MSDLKAKRSKLLDTLKQELSKGFVEREVEISGHKYKLCTLNEDAETWADSFIRTASTASILSSRKAPRIAASIQSIDGISISNLFEYPDDMSSEQKKSMDENPLSKKMWVWTQMLYFLAEDASRPFINKLYEAFDQLERERDTAVTEIPKA
jgi:hypothetical protein